jgi:hypothetical protein
VARKHVVAEPGSVRVRRSDVALSGDATIGRDGRCEQGGDYSILRPL